MKEILRKIKQKCSFPAWNIGFVNMNEESFVHSGFKLDSINWMRHSYKDRFFADPFILEIREKCIDVLVEELPFKSQKGQIVKLTINKDSYVLLERIPLLTLDTHLSYPYIFRYEGEVFVIPENGESGQLSCYKYEKNSLKFVQKIIDEPLTDATFLTYNGCYYVFSTKGDNEKLWIYYSKDPFNNYILLNSKSFLNSLNGSRPAGNFFNVGGKLYRPAQICNKSYGEGMLIKEITQLNTMTFQEKEVCRLIPDLRFDYNYGMHTLNFYKEYGVVDGLRYNLNIGNLINKILCLLNKFIYKSIVGCIIFVC